MRLLIAALAAIVVVGGAGAVIATATPDVHAQPSQVAQAPSPRGPAAGPRTAGPDDFGRRLNLTEEQTRRVRELRTASQQQTAKIRIDLDRARLDAQEALLPAAPDRARLDTIAARIGTLQGQLTAARLRFMADLKQVLTAEQWAQLQSAQRGRGRPGRGPRR